MNVDKVKQIYHQAEEKTREYNQFIEDATERASEIGGLGFYNHASGFAIQLTTRVYDQMDKSKMANFIGELSEMGFVHTSFYYEGIKVIVCFSATEVQNG